MTRKRGVKEERRMPFAPLRDQWEDFKVNLSREYVHRPTITEDDQLMPWRRQCAFLQYVPSKPDKYGIKIFSICDCANGFPLHGDPYLGRNGQERETNIGRNTALALASAPNTSRRGFYP